MNLLSDKLRVLDPHDLLGNAVEAEAMEDTIRFLLNLADGWAEEPPEGLDPTFYKTLSYAGDLKIYTMVQALREKYL